MPRALVVDDDASSLTALGELIALEGFEVRTAAALGDARAAFGLETPDVLLLDLMLPDGSGLELLQEAAGVGVAVVLITGHASVDTAVEALRLGATDYLTKPVDLGRLKTILANVARTRELQAEIGSLRGELRKLGRFGPLVGASPAMGNVYDLIARVAPTDATVLIVGESGTGKEVVAQAVHQLSRRRKAPFVPVNCGAVSPSLIESSLFGHEKGSFTGADRTHRGYFEQAAGGTLFLDEITEMPIELQVKLLRVLETGTVMRVGGEKGLAVDVRVVAATNRVPEQAVAEGRLREDLWYRLNVFPILLPPLRERGGDIAVLAHHFLAELNGGHGSSKRWADDAHAVLGRHAWPGNVRELKNLVHRAYILAEQEITAACLPPEIGAAAASSAPLSPAGGAAETGQSRTTLQVAVGSSVADVEQRLILATLEQCKGNKQKASEILGVSLKTLYNRLNEYRGRSTPSGSAGRGPIGVSNGD
ncbi:MAG: sigma-54-dependent transcriptional regulator [Candidatus Binatia bacterium]